MKKKLKKSQLFKEFLNGRTITEALTGEEERNHIKNMSNISTIPDAYRHDLSHGCSVFRAELTFYISHSCA